MAIPTDPPMEPYDDSVKWFESGPDPILKDPDLATLIVSIGIASNALGAQVAAAKDALRRPTASRVRDVLSSLVVSAGLTNEAIKLASSGMQKLRPLAEAGGASGDVVDSMGQLCAGKHPSADILSRARNKIGFHFDRTAIGTSVREFGKNKKIVWLETAGDGSNAHRLAIDVISHLLFPEASREVEQDASDGLMREAMQHVHAAMKLTIKFFTAALLGYMRACGAERRERNSQP